MTRSRLGRQRRAPARRCRSTRAAASLGGEERDVGADAGQRVERPASGASSSLSRRGGPAARPRPRPTSRRPARPRPATRFSSARQTSSGSLADPRHQAAPGQVRRRQRQRSAPSALDPQARAAGHQEQAVGQLEEHQLAVQQVEAIGAAPDDRSDRFSLAGASSRSGVMPRPPGAAPSWRRRQAHSSSESVCGTALGIDPAGREGRRSSRSHRQLAAERVVQLLAPLPEAGLHQAVERLALAGREDAARPGGAGGGPPSRRSGAGSKAAAGTRATTSASATFWTKTDR